MRRFAIERNWVHVHGLFAVGALMPAALRMSMFAKTLYVCIRIGTPVILVRPKLTVFQSDCGIDALKRFEMSGERFAR